MTDSNPRPLCPACGGSLMQIDTPAVYHCTRCGRTVMQPLAPGDLTLAAKQSYRISVTPTDERLLIRWDWFSPNRLFILPFILIMLGLTAAWLYLVIASYDYFGDGLWAMFPILTLLLLSDVGLLYTAAVHFLNYTQIAVTRQAITVKTMPLRWPGAGSFSINRSEIASYLNIARTGAKGAHYSALEVHTVDGHVLALVQGRSEMETYHICQTIEDWSSTHK